MKILSRLFILFGLLWCLMGGYYFWMQFNPNRLNFQNYTNSQIKEGPKQIKQDKPTPKRIVINDLSINLLLIPASIKDDIWETTHDGASYLTSSSYPGDIGNSVMYGHNWANLFGNLVYAKPGQVVEVTYADESKKRFVIEYTSTVFPTESSILAASQDKRITLYTCTGFLDSKRFVVVAVLADDKPSFGQLLKSR